MRKFWKDKGLDPEGRHDITIHTFGSPYDFVELIERLYRARKRILRKALRKKKQKGAFTLKFGGK